MSQISLAERNYSDEIFTVGELRSAQMEKRLRKAVGVLNK